MATCSARPLGGQRLQKLLSLQGLCDEPQAAFGPSGCVLPARFAESAPLVKAFEVRDDDVWIAASPRSGSTWAQEMVWLILHDMDFETSKKETLFTRSPFIEFSRFLDKSFVEKVGVDTLSLTANAPSPRCIKTHLHKDLLPDQLWTKKAKVIFVTRDPKDVAVSFYHQYQLTRQYTGDKNFFFECFFEDIVTFAPFWEHVLAFWKMKDEPNIMFIKFSEMKKDMPAVIKRVATFLGKSYSEEQVARLADHLDITSMLENEKANLDSILLQGDLIKKGERKFIRKGVDGEGRREMPAAMAALYDARSERVFSAAVGGCPWEV